MSEPPAHDLPDVNVLVALTVANHVHHHAAENWLAETARFATTPITEAGLLRMILNPNVGGGTTSDGVAALRSLREHSRAMFLPDDSSLAEPAIELHGLSGYRQVTDVHLVNLAARHGMRFVTFDAKLAPTLSSVGGLVHTLH